MQNPKKKAGAPPGNAVKQLPPSANQPEVLSLKLFSPFDIERQQYLEKLEELKGIIKKKDIEIFKLKENLHWADKIIHLLEAQNKSLQQNFSTIVSVASQQADMINNMLDFYEKPQLTVAHKKQ